MGIERASAVWGWLRAWKNNIFELCYLFYRFYKLFHCFWQKGQERKKQFSPCDLVGVNTSFTSCISFTLFVHNIPLCMSVDDCLCFLLKTPPFPFLRRLSPSLLCNAKMIIPNCWRRGNGNVWEKNCNFHSQIAHSMHPNNGVLSVLPFTTPEKKLFVPHKYLWRHVHKCPMHSGITNFQDSRYWHFS